MGQFSKTEQNQNSKSEDVEEEAERSITDFNLIPLTQVIEKNIVHNQETPLLFMNLNKL